MKIHNVVEETEDRWVMDPVRGPIQRRETILRSSGVHAISHEGKLYKIGKDGAFEVPNEVGQFYLRQARGWHEGVGVPLLPDPAEMELDTKKKA